MASVERFPEAVASRDQLRSAKTRYKTSLLLCRIVSKATRSARKVKVEAEEPSQR